MNATFKRREFNELVFPIVLPLAGPDQVFFGSSPQFGDVVYAFQNQGPAEQFAAAAKTVRGWCCFREPAGFVIFLKSLPERVHYLAFDPVPADDGTFNPRIFVCTAELVEQIDLALTSGAA